MGNIFWSQKPLKDIVRENQRMINKAIRELDREIKNLEKNSKKLENDIKKAGRDNQINAARMMAKDLVRTRRNISRFIELKSHLNGVSMKLLTIKSHDAMANALKGVTTALTTMNKQIPLPGLQKIMVDFARENEKSELTQEAIADTLDGAMEEDGAAEEEDLIVSQVLDELGIGHMNQVPDAPMGQKDSLSAPAPAAAESMPQAIDAMGAEEGFPSEGPSGRGDTSMSALEERLHNLKRN